MKNRIMLFLCTVSFLWAISSCGNVSTADTNDVPEYSYEEYDHAVKNEDKVTYRLYASKYYLEARLLGLYFDFRGHRIASNNFDGKSYIGVYTYKNEDDSIDIMYNNYHINFENRKEFLTFIVFEDACILLTEYFEREYTDFEEVLNDIMSDKINLNEILVKEAKDRGVIDEAPYMFENANIHEHFKKGIIRGKETGEIYEEIGYE